MTQIYKKIGKKYKVKYFEDKILDRYQQAALEIISA